MWRSSSRVRPKKDSIYLFIYLFIYKKNIIPAQVNFVYQATKMLAFQRLYNVFKETCAKLLNPIFDIKQ